MAKTTHCAFCGKEITTGFFSGDANAVYIKYDRADCCEECYEKYHSEAKRVEKRLKVKLDNYKAATKSKKLDSLF